MMGHMIKHADVIPYTVIEKAMAKVVSAKKQNLFDANINAVNIGYNY